MEGKEGRAKAVVGASGESSRGPTAQDEEDFEFSGLWE